MKMLIKWQTDILFRSINLLINVSVNGECCYELFRSQLWIIHIGLSLYYKRQ